MIVTEDAPHTLSEVQGASQRLANDPQGLVAGGPGGPGGSGADARPPRRALDGRMIFFLGLLLAASGFVSPALALVGGIAYGFVVVHPYRQEAQTLARLLLQASVVLLGFGLNLQEVLRVGRSGVAYTAVSIGAAVVLGLLLGRIFQVGGKASYLITLGTAICGGSAIAALAPILDADEEEISVSMGTVFVLNSVALLLFPAVGWWLHLSQRQFGLWAALAIHDTSSVVGAAARYGPEALAIGTTIKLARALWIVPVSLVTAALVNRNARASQKKEARKPVSFPWCLCLLPASRPTCHASRVPSTASICSAKQV
jgi:uncharacterized integral membrane protein (TIGR00698 family)